MKNSKIEKGDRVTYIKNFNFGKSEERTSKVILATKRKILLEDGTTIWIID